MNKLFLASRSPRRAQLLEQVGVAFEPFAIDIDESQHTGEEACDYVRRLAEEKASAGLASLPLVPGQDVAVLAADTIVTIDGQLLGKPADAAAAAATLRQLSGRSHRVATAVVLAQYRDGQRLLDTALSLSEVSFRPLGEQDIKAYCATGEPFDKAGAYAIQGLAALFVHTISGSYSGIMGLPLFETGQLLERAGIATALGAAPGQE